MSAELVNANRTILLVEDNPAEVRLLMEVLQENGSIDITSINHVKDGVEALDYLTQKGNYSQETLPDLIILDLNLPIMDGKQVLTFIKNDSKLQSIPVIIFSNSDSDVDISFAYNHHANCYIRKPISFDDFFDVVKSIETFWFSVATLH